MKIPPGLVAPIINTLYRIWTSTLRYTMTGYHHLWDIDHGGGMAVLAFWHDELFPLLKIGPDLRKAAMVSQSRDGEYLARLLHSLGIRTVRGSNSRNAFRALLEAGRVMRDEKRTLCLSVDGPRGPRHEVKDGAVILAHRTGAPIIPVRLYMERAKKFGSWDRFQLPWPFSRVHAIFGEPYHVKADKLSQEMVADESKKLAERLQNLAPKRLYES